MEARQNQFSAPVTVFHERRLPEEMSKFDQPRPIAANKKYSGDWQAEGAAGDSRWAFIHCQRFTTMAFVNNRFEMYVPFP